LGTRGRRPIRTPCFRDGERFLVPQFVATADAAGGQLGPDQLSALTVAVNWTASVSK
jgi:hypothetical protein